MKKINTTGSFKLDDKGNYWSYNTQLTTTYKGHTVFNNIFYSASTRRHQSNVPYYLKKDIVLNYACEFGSIDCNRDFKNEISTLKSLIKDLKHKRNTKKKINTIKAYANNIKLLNDILIME